MAKELYNKNNEWIMKYEKRPLLKMLTDYKYHSAKINETDEEDNTKSVINIYDYS